ncbi:MAG: T9SS type A sorting domain-containing protein, partial [bacterium]
VGRNPVVGIAENRTETPKKLSLKITPNPAKNYCNITFVLPVSGDVIINLYSIDGRLIKSLEKDFCPAGTYERRINTEELASGLYILLLRTNTRNLSSLMVITR